MQASKGKETVHTFGWYLRQMIEDVRRKEAIVVLSGMVPRNYWDKRNKTIQESWVFSDYAKQQAAQSKVEFLDHARYSVKALQGLGFEKAGRLFPQDKTHTGEEGAKLNADTFVQAIKCENGVLEKYLSDKGKSITDKTKC